MRSFEFARKMENGVPVQEPDNQGVMCDVKAFPDAQLPEYQTAKSAGADFFCAEEVVIPSIWHGVFHVVSEWSAHVIRGIGRVVAGKSFDEDMKNTLNKQFSPTLIHTGIKASMEEDEVLDLFNRSSNPKKIGLVLANGVGVVDADYYNNTDNDGEIMFAFYNFKPWNVTIKVGDRIGQGVFSKFYRPTVGLRVKDVERVGGIGSTDNK